MLSAVFLLGLLFIGIAFLINKKNAKYLLSGYNTMSKVEQGKVAIKPYLTHFKRFHIFLGSSVILIGSLVAYLNENWALPFLTIYPLLAYTYFLRTSKKFFSQLKKNNAKMLFAVLIIAGSLLLVLSIFIKGNSEDKLLIKGDRLIIEGFYGEEIPLAQIDSFVLTSDLPKIIKRTNGYSSGDVRKGYFQTSLKKRVKLILHSRDKPFLYIKTKGNHKIYYSVDEKKNRALFKKISAVIKT
jgi:hypothetical protein